MTWPTDPDGDVFRRLHSQGFDFSKSYSVDYTIDFTHWPPPREAIELLQHQFGEVKLFAPDGSTHGYALLQEHGSVTYERVVQVQRSVSLAMQPFGGVCESWGVLH